MGTQNLFLIKTSFVLVEMGSLIVSLSRKLVLFFFSYLFTLFGFIKQFLFRLKGKYIIQKISSNSVLIQPQDHHQIEQNSTTIKEEKSDDLGKEEDDESESFLRFKFPTYEEFIQNNEEWRNVEDDHSTKEEEILCDKSNDENIPHVKAKVDVQSEEIVGPQILKSEIVNSAIIDEQVNSAVQFVHDGNGLNCEEDRDTSYGDQSVVNVTEENSPRMSSESEVSESLEELESPNEEQSSNVATNLENNAHYSSDDDEEEEYLVSDSDSETMVSSTKSSFRSSVIDSISDGFLSDIDFERAFEVDDSMEFNEEMIKSTEKGLTEDDIELQNLMKGYETDGFEDEDEEILQELKNIEESNLENSTNNNVVPESKPESKQNSEQKPSSGEQLSSDSDEQNELERQWEHQDLVEQLKMEIKKVRAIGLPTILEESESPKITEDLKPWKIEEKFQHEGTLDELHKFYKSYRERMRKLDILNYQKMYAIGFLRLKDPLQSFSRNRISAAAMTTIVSLDCWPCKTKSAKDVHQPVMKRFSKELESDLEMVYVGQMCLSWEFLQWEYGKALELWDSDPHGIRRYNEVAGKFQQFQVLLTRFIEDDRFEGPRVQHYVKTRCVLRNLIQVPVIREDNSRDKRKERKMVSSKDAITSVKLVEMIEESIRIFWRFIRGDKDTSNSALLLKCRRSSNVELQTPADAKLLAEVRSSLQKKERKLKELSRSENCILRKLQPHQEDGSDNVLYFFSQVDMKLVQRVLNMSKLTTEQLVWCSDKLGKINFGGRKLHVDPSFLLFPCS